MENNFFSKDPELANLIAEAVGQAISNYRPIPRQEKEKVYKTRKEICEKLRISSPTLWKYSKSGEIPSVKIGGRVLYDVELVEQVLRTRNFKPKR